MPSRWSHQCVPHLCEVQGLEFLCTKHRISSQGRAFTNFGGSGDEGSGVKVQRSGTLFSTKGVILYVATLLQSF